MKYLHHATLTVFAKPEENHEDIRAALIELAGIPQPNVITTSEPMEGVDHSNAITVSRIELSKTSETTAFLKSLLTRLGDQRELLAQQAASRLDEDFDFFIRIDKSQWITKRAMKLTDHGSCFHLKLSLAVFPKNRTNALALVERIFAPR